MGGKRGTTEVLSTWDQLMSIPWESLWVIVTRGARNWVVAVIRRGVGSRTENLMRGRTRVLSQPPPAGGSLRRGPDRLTTTRAVAKGDTISFRRLKIGGNSPFSKCGLIVLRAWVYKCSRCVEMVPRCESHL